MQDPQLQNPDYLHRSRELIESLLSQRKFDQVIQFFADSHEELFGKESRDSALLRYLQARAYFGASHLPSALKAARRAEVELGRFGETVDLAKLYLTLGAILREMGEKAEAERCYRDAESIFRRCDDSVGRGTALNRLAQLAFLKAEFRQAINLLADSLELSRERNDVRRMAFLYGNLGRVQSFAGSSIQAIENLQMNIELSGQLGDVDEVVRARLSLGYEFVRLGRFAEAEAEFEQTEETIRDRKLDRERAQLLTYRAELAVKRRNFDFATEALAEGYRLARRIAPNGDLFARVLRGMAELALAEEKYQRAFKFALESAARFKELGEKVDQGVMQRIMAEAEFALGRSDEARDHFESSLELLDGAHAAFELAQALEWSGTVGLFSTHKRLANLFRAQELQARRNDVKASDRIARYIASADAFRLSPADDQRITKPSPPSAQAPNRTDVLPEVVTANARMKKILAQLSLVRNADLPILLTGETGVGKGHIAKRYHALVCPDRPFVPVNVTNIPETLLESQLFGHVRGAFTDATSSAPGLLDAANGGVLFLDEIGEMPLRLQMRLLSVIEDKRFRPVGSTQEIRVEFTLVTATNCDLKAMVAAGDFRSDLYHRLEGMPFEIPPLRERKEDIPLLLAYYLRRNNMLGEDEAPDPELVRRFLAYSWPGNVRELENMVKRMKALSALASEGSMVELVSNVLDREVSLEAASLPARVEQFERENILDALIASNWNKSAAARLLQVHESTLRAKLKRHNLGLPGYEDDSDLGAGGAVKVG